MGSCEFSNEPSDSIRGGEFLDKLSDISFSRTLLHGAGITTVMYGPCN
jgi:hypothetical protein